MDFNSTGGMRSPFSPRVRQSISGRRPIGLSSAKKNQSKFIQMERQGGDLIYKTPVSTVETFGMPLPVMVTETLTFASGDVSVRLSPCGWCWLVAGRRVLAWPREPLASSGASPAPASPAAARELTLPQTDLAHKADLVCVFYEDSAQMPSCIGVSPEGIVRYWPSLGQEGVYVDISAELAGQECERLGEYTRAGLVLATTTCTIVLLEPTVVDGRATVSYRTLRPPSGWLGGIGRRVSLLFFGSMPAHADTKLVGVVVLSEEALDKSEPGCIALVAGGAGSPGILQLWRGADLHEHSLRRALAEAGARAHLTMGDLNSLEIMALDVRASGNNGLLLLVAAINVARSPEMRYAIAHISVEDPAAPRVTSLVPLRSWGREDPEETPRFLPLGPCALLYTTKYIAIVSTTISNEKVDYIDVTSEGDKILGAELCNGVPLLFSKKHGVLVLSTSDSLAPTPSLCDSPMGSPCPSDMYDGNLSLYEIDPHEVSMVTTDACGKLKTAFLFHLRRDTVACKSIIDELFPPPPAPPLQPPSSPLRHRPQVDVPGQLKSIIDELFPPPPAPPLQPPSSPLRHRPQVDVPGQLKSIIDELFPPPPAPPLQPPSSPLRHRPQVDVPGQLKSIIDELFPPPPAPPLQPPSSPLRHRPQVDVPGQLKSIIDELFPPPPAPPLQPPSSPLRHRPQVDVPGQLKSIIDELFPPPPAPPLQPPSSPLRHRPQVDVPGQLKSIIDELFPPPPAPPLQPPSSPLRHRPQVDVPGQLKSIIDELFPPPPAPPLQPPSSPLRHRPQVDVPGQLKSIIDELFPPPPAPPLQPPSSPLRHRPQVDVPGQLKSIIDELFPPPPAPPLQPPSSPLRHRPQVDVPGQLKSIIDELFPPPPAPPLQPPSSPLRHRPQVDVPGQLKSIIDELFPPPPAPPLQPPSSPLRHRPQVDVPGQLKSIIDELFPPPPAPPLQPPSSPLRHRPQVDVPGQLKSIIDELFPPPPAPPLQPPSSPLRHRPQVDVPGQLKSIIDELFPPPPAPPLQPPSSPLRHRPQVDVPGQLKSIIDELFPPPPAPPLQPPSSPLRHRPQVDVPGQLKSIIDELFPPPPAPPLQPPSSPLRHRPQVDVPGQLKSIIDELFPPPPAPPLQPPSSPLRHRSQEEEKDVDGVLDRTVLKIAQEMLDDIPAGDPRWKQKAGNHTNIALGSSAALQVAAQLRDKQRALELFIDLLRATGLWHRLALVSRETGGGVISTQCALGLLAEQLAIAITLRKLQQGTDAQLIDAAIYQVVCGENPEIEEDAEVEAALSSGALSPSDVLYRRVRRVPLALRALARSHPPQSDARAAAWHARATIHILTSVLTEVHKCRGQWQSQPVLPQLGPRALLPSLVELHKRAITQCAHNCPDANLRAQVYEAGSTLADLILTEASPLQHNAHTAHIYERMRHEAIQPFIDEGQTERAAALAEKFKDFELLIGMCVKVNDMEKLYSYIDKYSNEGMGEATFAWLGSHGGGTSAQLIRSVGARYPAALTAWLSAAAQRQPLLALHHVAARQYAQAARRLADMACEETESVCRMATMASLAKLCLLASEEADSQLSDAWRKVESRMSLSEQHAALPRDIRIHNGLDAEDTRVMPPEDLVQMYIESESKALTEYDYKKALDLTEFITDMERRDDLRLRVWCSCIRRDDWSVCRVDAPAEELQQKMFFQLIHLHHVMGGDLELLLPPLEDIMTAPELAELGSDPKFQFIIKYGYECVDAMRNDHAMEA